MKPYHNCQGQESYQLPTKLTIPQTYATQHNVDFSAKRKSCNQVIERLLSPANISTLSSAQNVLLPNQKKVSIASPCSHQHLVIRESQKGSKHRYVPDIEFIKEVKPPIQREDYYKQLDDVCEGLLRSFSQKQITEQGEIFERDAKTPHFINSRFQENASQAFHQVKTRNQSHLGALSSKDQAFSINSRTSASKSGFYQPISMSNTQTNGITAGGKYKQSDQLPQQRLKSETRQLQLNCHQSTQNTCDNSINESTVVAPKLAEPKPKSKLPWLSAYKVNFNKFVKIVLNGELINLSLQDQSIELHLRRFLSPGTIEAFLTNNEKHFRMQFVIELVHALIDCIKGVSKGKAQATHLKYKYLSDFQIYAKVPLYFVQSDPQYIKVSHCERFSNRMETDQMQIEDARSSLLRDAQNLRDKEQYYIKKSKLDQMKVNDAMKEIKYIREHQEKVHAEELQKIQQFIPQFLCWAISNIIVQFISENLRIQIAI